MSGSLTTVGTVPGHRPVAPALSNTLDSENQLRPFLPRSALSMASQTDVSQAFTPDAITESERTTIHWLPNETLDTILSNLVQPEIILFNSPNDPAFLHRQTSIFPIRLVSHRFKSLVDTVLAQNYPRDIWLVGALPIDDTSQLQSICLEYMTGLRTMLAPLLGSKMPFNIRVHLLPELFSMRAEINWELGPVTSTFLDGSRPGFKDGCTAARTMAGHYLAAITLSHMLRRILEEDDGAVKRVTIRLMLHEVDGCTSEISQLSAEDPRRETTFLPFWDIDAVSGVVAHWKWIRQAARNSNPQLGEFMTLPVIAWPTLAGITPEHVLEKSYVDIMEAWRYGRVEEFTDTVVKFRISGSKLKIRCPSNDMLALWLTTLSIRMVGIRCFAIRGMGIFSPGDSRLRAVLLERPMSLLNAP
ncbi:hypothetical protein ABEF95_015323 [Exophiala dermatitidis]